VTCEPLENARRVKIDPTCRAANWRSEGFHRQTFFCQQPQNKSQRFLLGYLGSNRHIEAAKRPSISPCRTFAL
jgi:hypothetical protein